MDADWIFEVETPLSFRVRSSRAYWAFIALHKHPAIRGQRRGIMRALAEPDEVRRSRKDANVLLFYRKSGSRWLAAVVRREDGTGFLITAYPTDSIKAGETVWTRSS
jgi:hypothetical protein